MKTQRPQNECKVSCHNEWDTLEEVIVGSVHGATVPQLLPEVAAATPSSSFDFFARNAGKPFPAEQLAAADRELEEFSKRLVAEGVVVRRPDPIDFSVSCTTPYFSNVTGLYCAMPRDVLLCIGNEIIEAPMSWRCRYFEAFAFRSLLREYFASGAKWTAAPRPRLDADTFAGEIPYSPNAGPQLVTSETEPLFDAADFIRCGRDIFTHRAHSANLFGIEWLRRHLGSDYNVHVLAFDDDKPMHIDATIMPLAPGRLLINPERVREVPQIFQGWDILRAPAPAIPGEHFHMASHWVSMNVLSLDEKRVFVEASEEDLIDLLERHEFEPIPVPFRAFNRLGGSFHCATLDVRRRGKFESYF